jgi:hypothetical protein
MFVQLSYQLHSLGPTPRPESHRHARFATSALRTVFALDDLF